MRSAHPHNGILRGVWSRGKGEKTHRHMKRAAVGKLALHLAGLGIPDLGRYRIVLLNEDEAPAWGKARGRSVAGTLTSEDVKQAPLAGVPHARHPVARAGRDAGTVGGERHGAGIQIAE